MRILQLSLRNYRVFEEVDLELPARVIGIFGPNGAGKSTICESVLWALYGRARTPKDQIRTHGVLTDCVARVVFEHGGQPYTVVRTIRGKNHATDAELFVGDLQVAAGVSEVDAEVRRLLRMDQQVFRASVYAEQKQLDAFSDVSGAKRKEMVLRLLGIKPVDDARTAARKAAREVRGSAETIAEKLPDVGELEAELRAARREAETAREVATLAAEKLEEAASRASAAEVAFAESDRVRQRIEKIEVERRGLSEQVEALAVRREELGARIGHLEAELEQVPALERELAALQAAPARLQSARILSGLAEEVRAQVEELEAIPELDPAAALAELQEAEAGREATREAAARAEAAGAQAAREVEAARGALERAAQADPSQPCPTCGRPLGEDFEQYVAHCRERLREAERGAREAQKVLRAARTAAEAADARYGAAASRGDETRDASRRRAILSDRLEQARSRFAEAAAPFGGEPPDLPSLEAEARRAVELDRRLVALRAHQRHLEQAWDDAAKAEEELRRRLARVQDLEEEQAGLGFDAEDHDRIRKERGEATRLLDEARVREREAAERWSVAEGQVKGLQGEVRQAREMRRRVGSLKDEARYLERVGVLLDGFRDHLVARIGPELSREAEALFRELTRGEYEDLRIGEEDLAIEISDGGAWFPIDRFSGSEVDLANLALRVAISVHLSRVSGADVGLMVLDEVVGALDEERKDLLVQAMGRLTGRFHQLLIITHSEQVKDAFPAAIEVTRVGRRRSRAVLV